MSKELSSNLIVQETKDLLLSVRRNYLAISANIYRLHEAWTGTVDSWVDFYEQELELSKSQVSKMRKVGEFLIAQGLLKATEKEGVGYEALYLSINRNPDADPKYIVSEAKTWSPQDHRDQDRENCTHPKPPITVCPDCFKRVDNEH